MPLALVLCFKKEMGIAGLWLGFTIACVILDIGFAMIISCPNWQKISEQARAQIKEKGDLSRTPEVRNLRKTLTPFSQVEPYQVQDVKPLLVVMMKPLPVDKSLIQKQ